MNANAMLNLFNEGQYTALISYLEYRNPTWTKKDIGAEILSFVNRLEDNDKAIESAKYWLIEYLGEDNVNNV